MSSVVREETDDTTVSQKVLCMLARSKHSLMETKTWVAWKCSRVMERGDTVNMKKEGHVYIWNAGKGHTTAHVFRWAPTTPLLDYVVSIVITSSTMTGAS